MTVKKTTKQKPVARKSTANGRKPQPVATTNNSYAVRVTVLAVTFTLLSLVFVGMAYFYYII